MVYAKPVWEDPDLVKVVKSSGKLVHAENLST